MLAQIWQAPYASGQFRPLVEMINQWNQECFENLSDFPDPNIAKLGCKHMKELTNSCGESVLLATDLHAGNIPNAQREDWLVIDIKPYIGDRVYDLTQYLLDCKEKLQSKPLETVHRLAALSGVDQTRLKRWMFARLATSNSYTDQQLAQKFR